MNINDIKDLSLFDEIDFKALINKKVIAKKFDGDDFITLTISDKSGKTEFPIWDKIEERSPMLEPGQIIRIVGTVGMFKDNKQIKLKGFEPIPEGQEDVSDYMPAYEIPTSLIRLFEDTYEKLSEPYKSYLSFTTGWKGDERKWSDYTHCVAASSGHQNKLGGLFIHSMGVLENINSMIKLYGEEPLFMDCRNVYNPDRLRVLALTHDLGKIEEYEFKKGIYYNQDCIWEHRMWYCTFMDTKVNGVVIGEDDVMLSQDDVDRMKYSVLAHHGPWGAFKPKTLEDTMLHLADMIDAKIFGCAEADNEKERINFGVKGMLDASGN